MVDETVGRFEVHKMITDAIERYDGKQDRRHQENAEKLDKLNRLLMGTLLTVLGGIFADVIAHFIK